MYEHRGVWRECLLAERANLVLRALCETIVTFWWGTVVWYGQFWTTDIERTFRQRSQSQQHKDSMQCFVKDFFFKNICAKIIQFESDTKHSKVTKTIIEHNWSDYHDCSGSVWKINKKKMRLKKKLCEIDTVIGR